MKIDKKTFQLIKAAPHSAYSVIQPYFLFHSNRLEGSTFSEEEIAKLAELKKISGDHDLDDIYETRNSIYVFDYLIDSLGDPINQNFIIKLNTMLLKDTKLDKMGLIGGYKKLANRILGANIEVSMPKDVDAGMEKLFDDWNGSKRTVEDIAKFHARFEHIHPFQDGNGRIGRFLILKQCIENNHDLIFVHDYNKETYLAWLEAANTLNNYSQLTNFFIESQKELNKIFDDKGITKMLDNVVED